MKGANICVIGGAGFLGSHLVDHLADDNKVLVLDNLIVGRREFVNPKAKFVWCDVTHSEFSLFNIFKKYNIWPRSSGLPNATGFERQPIMGR